MNVRGTVSSGRRPRYRLSQGGHYANIAHRLALLFVGASSLAANAESYHASDATYVNNFNADSNEGGISGDQDAGTGISQDEGQGHEGGDGNSGECGGDGNIGCFSEGGDRD